MRLLQSTAIAKDIFDKIGDVVRLFFRTILFTTLYGILYCRVVEVPCLIELRLTSILMLDVLVILSMRDFLLGMII